ncbi:MAG: sugar transferase [Lachnospiraceae bacterium]|nr:sugar transferase [Lachnospiraceae bacterium]
MGENRRRTKHFDFMILDLIIAELSFVLGYYLRHFDLQLFKREVYIQLVFLMIISAFINGFIADNYKNILKRGYFKEFVFVLKYVFVYLCLMLFFLFFSKTGAQVARTSVIYSVILSFILIYPERCIWKAYLINRLKKDDQYHILILAHSNNVKKTMDAIMDYPFGAARLVGLVTIDDAFGVGESIGDVKVVSTFKNITAYLSREWIDAVYIDLSGAEGIAEDALDGFLEDCSIMGITTHRSIMRDSKRNVVQYIDKFAGNIVLTERMVVVPKLRMFEKRCMDILGGIIGIFFTGILVLFVGPFIFFTDPGPIFFKQKRVGQNGHIFEIYKFRSMYLDAEKRKKEFMDKNSMQGLMFKMENDPRILGSGEDGKKHGIGWFIRKSSIDEFPQFFNVLKGDMSLVGSRPPTLDEWERYEPHHRARLVMKPGITGLWQTSGRNSISNFEDVIKLDIEYINTWSIPGDIKLIIKTIGLVLSGNGK